MPHAFEAAAEKSFCGLTPLYIPMTEFFYAALKTARRSKKLTNAPFSPLRSLPTKFLKLDSLLNFLLTSLNLKMMPMRVPRCPRKKKRKPSRIFRFQIARGLTFRTPKGP